MNNSRVAKSPAPVHDSVLDDSDSMLDSLRQFLLMAESDEAKNLSPDEKFEKSFAEIKQYVRAHGWDAAAMFFGTAVYMGVYYAEGYFKIFGPVGKYIVHNLAMGVAANAIAVPFVRAGRLAEGETKAVANRDSFRYFLLCTVPDSLFQPVEDWFIAMTQSGSPIDFEFVQYATASFSAAEVAVSFSMFGVAFGILYLVMKKMLLKHDDVDNAEVEKVFDDNWHQFCKKTRAVLETPTWESVKSAIQYFIFYISDYFFDSDVKEPKELILNAMYSCALMASYSFVFDNLPELFGYLQIRRERALELQAQQVPEPEFAPESLDANYVLIQSQEDAIENDIVCVGNVDASNIVEKTPETAEQTCRDESSVRSVVTNPQDNVVPVRPASPTLVLSQESGSEDSARPQSPMSDVANDDGEPELYLSTAQQAAAASSSWPLTTVAEGTASLIQQFSGLYHRGVNAAASYAGYQPLPQPSTMKP